MSFKFSFFSEEEVASEQGLDVSDDTTTLVEEKAEEIQASWVKHSSESTTYGQVKLNYGLCVRYIQQPEKHVITDSTGSHTDLVPGVYEGGRKTWECSFILLDYLSEMIDAAPLSDKSVLEVGCGSGLPGIFCLLKGAKVTFQDYNKDVIEEITMPNIQLSCGDNFDFLDKCRFFSGDWKYLPKLILQEQLRYDLILASETLYSTQSYCKLHEVFSRCSADDGVVYLASKYHYFGVGGGVESFTEYVNKCGVFDAETVLTTDDNLKCVVLKLTKKKR